MHQKWKNQERAMKTHPTVAATTANASTNCIQSRKIGNSRTPARTGRTRGLKFAKNQMNFVLRNSVLTLGKRKNDGIGVPRRIERTTGTIAKQRILSSNACKAETWTTNSHWKPLLCTLFVYNQITATSQKFFSSACRSQIVVTNTRNCSRNIAPLIRETGSGKK